VISKRMGLYVF